MQGTLNSVEFRFATPSGWAEVKWCYKATGEPLDLRVRVYGPTGITNAMVPIDNAAGTFEPTRERAQLLLGEVQKDIAEINGGRDPQPI